jgi:transcriptional regulator with XRE-family HTH domain
MQVVRPKSPFGPQLRSHRQARALSQERLADAAEVSTRHLSCLETGRASPSREMVLVLASALELPLRERNVLLGAAGFSTEYAETKLDAAGMRDLNRAIDHLLNKLEPYPAVVVDRRWNILKTNASAARFLPLLLPADAPFEVATNALRALLDPRGARPYIANWAEVVASLVERTKIELARETDEDERRARYDELLAYPGVRDAIRSSLHAGPPLPFVPVHVRRDAIDARFFTMLTSIGTPLDVTAEELRIEAYFPADDTTRLLMEQMAGAS